MAREALEPGEFVEVFVDVPLHVAEGRDPKGLYKRRVLVRSRTSPASTALMRCLADLRSI